MNEAVTRQLSSEIVEITSLRNCHLGPPPGTRLKLVQPLGGAGA